jgi:hypothetical protein
MDDGTNDYFSLYHENTIDSNHDTAKIYSFKSDLCKYYHPLSELDLYHAYLCWDMRNTAKSYMCEMMADKKAN